MYRLSCVGFHRHRRSCTGSEETQTPGKESISSNAATPNSELPAQDYLEFLGLIVQIQAHWKAGSGAVVGLFWMKDVSQPDESADVKCSITEYLR